MPRADSEIRSKMDNGPSAPRLDGWKDIATCLGKSERTVKRWERDRALPIHRVPGGGRATVYAFRAELDEWLKSSNAADADEPAPEDVLPETPAVIEAAANTPESAAPTPVAAPPATRPAPRFPWLLALCVFLLAAVAIPLVALHGVRASLSGKALSFFAKKPKGSNPAANASASEAEKSLAQGLYLKGRYEWNQRTPDSLNRALDLFTQAVVHDPNDAQAYVGLADTYDLLREYSTMPENEAYARAIVAARKAVEIDDSLSEAHRALAFAEMYGNWDFANAEKEFRRAIELNPNDPEARRWYANAIAVRGRFRESLDQIDKAQQLDPSSHATLADKGWMLYNAGRTEEGVELLKEVERSVPDFRSPHVCLMRIGLDQRDYPGYLAEGAKTAEAVRDPVLKDIVAAAKAGYQRDGGRGLLNALYARQKQYRAAGKIGATVLARTCVLMGKKQEALQLLEEAYANHEPEVLSCLSHPGFLSMKDEPRYRALVRKIDFPGMSLESPADFPVKEEQPLQAATRPH